jgi:hypothetical protein
VIFFDCEFYEIFIGFFLLVIFKQISRTSIQFLRGKKVPGKILKNSQRKKITKG